MTSFFSSKKSPKETLSSLSKIFQTKVKKNKTQTKDYLRVNHAGLSFCILHIKIAFCFYNYCYSSDWFCSISEAPFQHRCVLFGRVICKHRCDGEMCRSIAAAAAAAKMLQLCPTLCDPLDGSPLGSTVPRILQARTLEWVAISFFNA